MTFAKFLLRSFSAACLALLLTLSGCALNDIEQNQSQPTLAADLTAPSISGGRGGCSCTNGCNQFETLHSVSSSIPSQIPFGGQYHYAVTVTPVSSCSPSLAGVGCQLKRRDFHLNFQASSIPSFSLSSFEQISLFSLAGEFLPLQISTLNNGIIANEPFVACFKLKPQFSNLQMNDAHFRSGGICIIGIITDPNGTGGSGTSTSGSNG